MLPIVALHVLSSTHFSTRQTPSGAEILTRSQAAYDSVQTLTEDATGTEGGGGQAMGNLKMGPGTAHIQFKRPGQLRVSGKAMFGSQYQLLCDGKNASVFNGGVWSQAQSPEMGVATITGLSLNAGMAVPALLLHVNWGSFRSLGKPGRVSRDTVAGRSTFRIEFTEPLKRTVWFDAKTYFLVKTATSIMGRTITVNFDKPIVNAPIPASAFKK